MIIQISKHISAIEMNATLTFSLFWRYLLTPNVCYPISITLFVQTGDADKGIFPWFVFWYLMPFKFFQKKPFWIHIISAGIIIFPKYIYYMRHHKSTSHTTLIINQYLDQYPHLSLKIYMLYTQTWQIKKNTKGPNPHSKFTGNFQEYIQLSSFLLFFFV